MTLVGTQSYCFGKSVRGTDLMADFIDGIYDHRRDIRDNNHILFIGVFHGDEPQGRYLLTKLTLTLNKLPDIFKDYKATIIPVLNPDGFEMGTRQNANGVDLNRNFPTVNWQKTAKGSEYYSGESKESEPETQALCKLISEINPKIIVTIHSPLHLINYDGPAIQIAECMARYNGYKVEKDIGYETPGSFGTYAGREKNIPTITLELPDNETDEKLWLDNKDALLSVFD